MPGVSAFYQLHFGFREAEQHDAALIQRGEGYEFANASDPARNLVQISSRRVTKHTQ